MPKIEPECLFCDMKLIFNSDHGFYKCPECGGEWWPGPPGYGDDILTLWRDEQRYKKSISKRGGGIKIKRRKKPTQKGKMGKFWLYET